MTPQSAIAPPSLPFLTLVSWSRGQLTQLELNPAVDPFEAAQLGDVAVAVFQRPVGVPAWQRFIRDALNSPEFGSASQSLGAIVFCAVADTRQTGAPTRRWLAWCFGSGSRSLRRTGSDPRFGLLTALNTLALSGATLPQEGRQVERAPQFRLLQYRTTAPFFQQTGHRAARDIPVEGFRLDRQSDLVSAIGGHTRDALIQDVLGGRSLRFRREVTGFDDLVKLSEELFRRSKEDRYTADFAWIDNITAIFDEDLIAALRQELVVQVLRNPPPANVDVLLPDDLLDLNDERSIQYILYPGERRASASRVTLTISMVAGLLARLANAEPPMEPLDADLRFLDASREPVGSSSILECLCADLWFDGQQFLAYDGDFYRVDQTFLRSIDQEVLAIPESGTKLPCYRGGDEPSYNSAVGQNRPDEFVVLDRSLIRLPGESGIEACDLVSANGALVHVKRKGKSSVLSHLFLQAGNSCEVLRRSPEARQQLRALIEGMAPPPELAEAVFGALDQLDPANTGDGPIEVVFAFLGDWRDRGITTLPLFSKVSLIQSARRIAQLGYQPTVGLVDICS